MRILMVHNSYQIRGGEDNVVAAEINLLREHGETTFLHQVSNDDLKTFWQKAMAWRDICYSETSQKKLAEKISRQQPDVVHVHNIFPLLTLSIYDACHDAGVPVVQTLHNYRSICPGALLMRNGKICEKCVAGSPFPAVLHRCYRNSLLGTLAVARMVHCQRQRQTWKNKVSRFIALSDFSRRKFTEAGFPANQIVVKPNFFDATKTEQAETAKRESALFVGRMSGEKGILTLTKAWRQFTDQLRVAGEGPLLEELKKNSTPNVYFLGRLDRTQVSEEMKNALFLIMPAECYENFPLVLAEAFAHGLPVLASRLGAMAEIVEEGVTGLHFEAGNAQDLAHKARWMSDHPEECRRMGQNARRIYELKYTPEQNYRLLMEVYRQAIEERRSKPFV